MGDGDGGAGVIVPAYIDPTPIYTVTGGLAALLAGAGGVAALVAGVVRGYFRWAGKYWRALAALAVLAVPCMWLFLRGRHQDTKGVAMNLATGNGRLVILALDGLSPEIVEPMMEAGVLPNLARLRETGSYRRLRTTNPPQSPVAWCTFATGRNPGKHGIYDFIRRNPSSYAPDLSLTRIEGGRTMTVRDTRAFWEFSVDTGVPVVVLGCPVTFPPDAVNGRMLSGMGTPDLLGTQGTFSFFTTDAEDVTANAAGQVKVVERADEYRFDLLGPAKQVLTGRTQRLSVPFSVTPSRSGQAASISLLGQAFDLSVGGWSDWQRVRFHVGPVRRMHGIVRFHLAELEPDLKLYVSPVSIDPEQPWFPISFPKSYSRELARAIGPFPTRGMPYDTWALSEGRISDSAFIEHADAVLAQRLGLFRRELARSTEGVLFCYFEYPDIIQHMYWRFRDPDHVLHDPDAPEKHRGMVDTCYEKMDEIVGLVLAEIGPSDTLVVLSDHGFTAFRKALHINTWLRRKGLLVLNDSAAEEGVSFFANVDWSRTRAYALGFGGVYLNLQGREPEGIVGPGHEADALLEAIAGGLQNWRDDATGDAMIRCVYRGKEIFRGHHAGSAPDLYVGTHRGYRVSWQTALGGAPTALAEDNAKKWSGTHLVDYELVPGILLSNREIRTTDPSIADIAPTVLRMMGVTKEQLANEDLDGTCLW